MEKPRTTDAIDTIAPLADPNRRRLYDLVVSRGASVGRDEAASSLGISRELAAFHLDRLVDCGLLETEYRRLSGRTGPGAGRPAKLYRRAMREVSVTLPPRDYRRAAAWFAAALDRLDRASVSAALDATAESQGRELALQARRAPASRRHRAGDEATLIHLLEDGGFEPRVGPVDGRIRLANCPYRAISDRYRDLTCGMNLAWATGVAKGLASSGLEVSLEPAPDACCVVFGWSSKTSGRRRDVRARTSAETG